MCVCGDAWSFVWAAVDFDIWVRLMVKLLKHMVRVVVFNIFVEL